MLLPTRSFARPARETTASVWHRGVSPAQARSFARVLALVAILAPLVFLALFGAPEAQAQAPDAGPSLIPADAAFGEASATADSTDGGVVVDEGGPDANILNQQAAGPTINIPPSEAE